MEKGIHKLRINKLIKKELFIMKIDSLNISYGIVSREFKNEIKYKMIKK
jgi:hypothetical protein